MSATRSVAFLIGLMIPALRAQALDEAKFELRTTRNPPVYQIGERIELELSFSTRSAGKYGFTSTSENRRAALLEETYSVSPASGAVDPRENEHVLGLGFAGSFGSGYSPL